MVAWPCLVNGARVLATSSPADFHKLAAHISCLTPPCAVQFHYGTIGLEIFFLRSCMNICVPANNHIYTYLCVHTYTHMHTHKTLCTQPASASLSCLLWSPASCSTNPLKPTSVFSAVLNWVCSVKHIFLFHLGLFTTYFVFWEQFWSTVVDKSDSSRLVWKRQRKTLLRVSKASFHEALLAFMDGGQGGGQSAASYGDRQKTIT
jgi:hypothetical protein